MVFLLPPNSNGLAASTSRARTNPPLTPAFALTASSNMLMFLREELRNLDADNATMEWGMEPIRRPKAGTGARSARGRRPALAYTGGTGLHWGHVGVPGCRPKAGAGWAEGPALRRAQCARGAVSSSLCTARGSAVCEPYIYLYTAIIYKYTYYTAVYMYYEY